MLLAFSKFKKVEDDDDIPFAEKTDILGKNFSDIQEVPPPIIEVKKPIIIEKKPIENKPKIEKKASGPEENKNEVR